MIVEQIKKWQSKLGEGFVVDATYAVAYKQLQANKQVKLNDTLFVELSIYYTRERNLLATIELIEVVSTSNSNNYFLGQTLDTLYNECISKDEKISNAKVIAATKEGQWLLELDRQVEIMNEKLEKGGN